MDLVGFMILAHSLRHWHNQPRLSILGKYGCRCLYGLEGGREAGVHGHLQDNLHHFFGCTREEVMEIILQMAVYAGFPADRKSVV